MDFLQEYPVMYLVVIHSLPVLAGFLLDLCIGDPHGLWHPVQGIGWMIVKLELVIRRIFPKTEKGQLAGGFLLVVCIIGLSAFIPVLLLLLLYRISFLSGFLLEIIFCWQLLATKSLKTESMKVYAAIQKKDTEAARQAVSMIVGRDTAHLTEEGIIKAAVETVAENTSDGTVAPLFYLVLGGVPLGFIYKAVNTMDSMIGYKNERYFYFGRIAARLDDWFNYIPSRLSGYFMIVSSFLLHLDGKNAYKIYCRDRRNHASPNSAQTEAAAAGALNIRLAGDAWYSGKLLKKQTIGDDNKPIAAEDIRRANHLLYGTSILALFVFVILSIFVRNCLL